METLELNDVTIRWISVSDMENNVYLITSKKTDKQVLIDAANDTAQIEKLVKEHGNGTLEAVLTTHSHPDHVQSLAEIARTFDARTLAGLYDVSEIESQTGIEIDEQLANDDMLEFDGFRLRAVHLKGHTPGSIAYVLRDYPGEQRFIFSGDSLFPGGPGKTTNPEDFTQLMNDLETRIFEPFADDTVVLPGHGARTELGAERPHLDEWRQRGW